MKIWQKDPKWKDLTIGKTGLKVGDYGCFVCALSYISGLEVDLCLKILNDNDCFTEKGLLASDLAAKALCLSYGGKVLKKQKSLCIAETDHFAKKGYPQHFFAWLGTGEIVDPLDGKKKSNPYQIVSYRLFKKKAKTKVLRELKTLRSPIVGRKSTTPLEAVLLWITQTYTTMLNFLHLKK